MTTERQEEIRQQLIGYYRSYQNDGEPIAVNFRSLVPELSKLERYTHLIHSYPAKLLANIPFFFFASDELCPENGIVLDPFCGTGTVLLEAALSGRTAWGADANPDMAEFSDDELKILEYVSQRFKNETPTQISETSHEEEAWKKYKDSDKLISFEMAFTLKAI